MAPEAPAEAWLHRIAINGAVSYRRRERVRGVAALLLWQPSQAPDAETSHPDLVSELKALPPKQGAALVLHYLHGYPNRGIAHSLGVPEGTVASRLAAARARLQSRLSEQEDPGSRVASRVTSHR